MKTSEIASLLFVTLIPVLVAPLNCSYAYEVSKVDSRVHLSDNSCDTVVQLSQQLDQWTKSLGIKKNCPGASDLRFLEHGQCDLDITECLPDHVVKYQGSKPANDGPNCWNLALVMKEILPALRYSTDEEMAFYMGPPLCRELVGQEPRKAGDVGAIRRIQETGTEEIHGFIYISDQIAYSKDGYQRHNPYTLEPLERVFSTYGVPQRTECRETQGAVQPSCRVSISYFRCMSMDDYLRQNSTGPSKLKDELNLLTQSEHCVEEEAVQGTPLSTVARSNILDVARALTTLVKDEMSHSSSEPEKNGEDRFLVGSLLIRLRGIAVQLASSGHTEDGIQINNLTYATSQSLSELKQAEK